MPQRTIDFESLAVNMISVSSLGLSIILFGWTCFEGYARIGFCLLGAAICIALGWVSVMRPWLQIQSGRMRLSNPIVSIAQLRRSRIPSRWGMYMSLAFLGWHVIPRIDRLLFGRLPVRAFMIVAGAASFMWALGWCQVILAWHIGMKPDIVERLKAAAEPAEDQHHADDILETFGDPQDSSLGRV